MAKGKDRPTAPTATSKSAATSRSPTAKPMQAKGPSRTAPDASATRPGDGQSRGNTAAKLSNEDVYKLIQESAYFKAKARGFAPGHEVQDWIEAEAEVRRRLEDRAT